MSFQLGSGARSINLFFALGAQLGPGAGASLALRGEAQQTPRVDQQLRGVELAADAELRGGVVEGILVVPVVPALAHAEEGHDRVLRRVAVGVVRVVSEQVGGGVHQPGVVPHKDAAQGSGHPVAAPEVLSPEHTGDGGEHEAHEQREPGVQRSLEGHHGVVLQVREVELSACFTDIFVLLDVEPANVGKEETSFGIVRVGIRLGKKG